MPPPKVCLSGCTITSKTKINVFWYFSLFRFLFGNPPLEIFKKTTLILAFEANNALSRENETKIVKITHCGSANPPWWPIFHEEHITMGGQDLITWWYCLLDKARRRRSMGEKAAAASPPSSVWQRWKILHSRRSVLSSILKRTLLFTTSAIIEARLAHSSLWDQQQWRYENLKCS